jgi:EAL domain-containing protein (putative c-di-GMP-specific phosphodiesterase class I)
LKIDKSFKQNVDSHEKEHRFIRSLVEIIKVGKKIVVVE